MEKVCNYSSALHLVEMDTYGSGSIASESGWAGPGWRSGSAKMLLIWPDSYPDPQEWLGTWRKVTWTSPLSPSQRPESPPPWSSTTAPYTRPPSGQNQIHTRNNYTSVLWIPKYFFRIRIYGFADPLSRFLGPDPRGKLITDPAGSGSFWKICVPLKKCCQNCTYFI